MVVREYTYSMDTTTQKDVYIAELHSCGLEATAAQRAGMTLAQVRTHYNNDPQFKEAANNVLELFNDALEQEAMRRATGYTVERRTKDGEIYEETLYSDKLMDKVLTARRPEVYGNKTQITGADGGPLQIAVSHFVLTDDGQVKTINQASGNVPHLLEQQAQEVVREAITVTDIEEDDLDFLE